MKLVKNILLFVSFGVITLIALELFIKWAFIISVSHSDYDESIGRIRRPNLRYVWNNEGLGIRKYNSFGYLGPSYKRERTEKSFRIALIGDSFIEGFQVFERNHLRSVLERNLQAKLPDTKIEVLNFGRSAFNVCKMYCYNKDFAESFNPDLTVFVIANEDYVEFSNDPVLPTCAIVDDSLFLDYSFREKPYVKTYNKYKFLTQNFATLQLLRNVYSLAKKGKKKIIQILLDISYKSDYQLTLDYKDPEIVSYQAKLTGMFFDNLDPDATMIAHRSEDSLVFPEIENYYLENNFEMVEIDDTIEVLEKLDIETRTMYSKNLRGHWTYASHEAIGKFLANKIHSFYQRRIEK